MEHFRNAETGTTHVQQNENQHGRTAICGEYVELEQADLVDEPGEKDATCGNCERVAVANIAPTGTDESGDPAFIGDWYWVKLRQGVTPLKYKERASFPPGRFVFRLPGIGPFVVARAKILGYIGKAPK